MLRQLQLNEQELLLSLMLLLLHVKTLSIIIEFLGERGIIPSAHENVSGIVDNNLIVDNDHIIDNNLILGEGDIIPPAQASFEALMAKPHASRSHKSRELLMTTIFRRWYEFRTCYINRVG